MTAAPRRSDRISKRDRSSSSSLNDYYKNRLMEELEPTFQRFVECEVINWNTLGLPESDQEKSIQETVKTVQNVIKELKQDHEREKNDIIKAVEKSSFEVYKLNKELGLYPREDPLSSTTKLLDLQREIRDKKKMLLQEKAERVKKLQLIVKSERELQNRLGQEPRDVDVRQVPSAALLEEVAENIDKLNHKMMTKSPCKNSQLNLATFRNQGASSMGLAYQGFEGGLRGARKGIVNSTEVEACAAPSGPRATSRRAVAAARATPTQMRRRNLIESDRKKIPAVNESRRLRRRSKRFNNLNLAGKKTAAFQ